MLRFSSISGNVLTPELLFVRNGIEGVSVVNIGELLSYELQQCDVRSSVFPMVANDLVRTILDQSVFKAEDNTKYLVITNIHILFEPALALNVESLFRSCIRTAVLVIVDDHPIAEEFYYPFGKDVDIRVDLTGIRYAEVF